MEEINFRELIQVLLKRKWIIIAFTLICIIAGAILSYFVLDPVYEAKSTIMVTPINITTGINPNTSIIFSGDPKALDSTRKLENKMLGSILGQVKYPQIDMNKVIIYMNSTEYITKVLKDLRIDIDKYDYIKNIKMELDVKTGLPSVTVKYNDADSALKIKEALVNYLPVYVNNEVNEYLKVTEDLLSQGIERETKNFETWKKKLSDFNVAVGAIDKLTPDKQGEYQGIYNNYILANQALDSYQIVKKEFDNIKAMDVKKMLNMQIITSDRLPIKPVAPKKALNLVIATVLGLMISVFIVSFMEYWEKSKIVNANSTYKTKAL